MKHITVFIYLLLILFIQIDQQQAAPIYITSIEDFQHLPLSWDDVTDDFEDRQLEQSIDRYYKRFVSDLFSPQRQPRFGNTKYGRSLLYE